MNRRVFSFPWLVLVFILVMYGTAIYTMRGYTNSITAQELESMISESRDIDSVVVTTSTKNNTGTVTNEFIHPLKRLVINPARPTVYISAVLLGKICRDERAGSLAGLHDHGAEPQCRNQSVANGKRIAICNKIRRKFADDRALLNNGTAQGFIIFDIAAV